MLEKMDWVNKKKKMVLNREIHFLSLFEIVNFF